MIKLTAWQYQQALMALPNPNSVEPRVIHNFNFVVPIMPVISTELATKEYTEEISPVRIEHLRIQFEIVNARTLSYWQPIEEILIVKEPV